MVHTIERLRVQVASWAADAAKALDSGELGVWHSEPGKGRRRGQVQVRLPIETADPLRATGSVVAAALPPGHFFQIGRAAEEAECREAFDSAASDQAVSVSTQNSDWHLEGYMNGCGKTSEALWRRISVRQKTRSKRADGTDPYAAVIVHKRHPRIALFLVVERGLAGDLARLGKKKLSDVTTRFPQSVTLSQGWVQRSLGGIVLDHSTPVPPRPFELDRVPPTRDCVASGSATAPTTPSEHLACGDPHERICSGSSCEGQTSLDSPIVARTSRKRGKRIPVPRPGVDEETLESVDGGGEDLPAKRHRPSAVAAGEAGSLHEVPICTCLPDKHLAMSLTWYGASAARCPFHDGPVERATLPRNAASAHPAAPKCAQDPPPATATAAFPHWHCAGSTASESTHQSLRDPSHLPRPAPPVSIGLTSWDSLVPPAGTFQTPEGSTEPQPALIRSIPSPVPPRHAPSTSVHFRAAHAPTVAARLEPQFPLSEEHAENEPSLRGAFDVAEDEMFSDVESIFRRPGDQSAPALGTLPPPQRSGPLMLAQASDPFSGLGFAPPSKVGPSDTDPPCLCNASHSSGERSPHDGLLGGH